MIFISYEFRFPWTPILVEIIRFTMSLIPILLVLLLFVVVLLKIFSFKLLLVDFSGHFLSSFPVYLSSRLLLTSRLAKLGDGRSTVSVELVVIPTKLIEPIIVEELAIRIYE